MKLLDNLLNFCGKIKKFIFLYHQTKHSAIELIKPTLLGSIQQVNDSLLQVDDRPDTLSLVHQMESLVDLL